MTYNIWGGGGNVGKPINETVAVMRAAQADIIGVQETRLQGAICNATFCPPRGVSVAAALAQSLEYHYYDQTKNNTALWANAVISRYPIRYATRNDLGVAIDVAGTTVFAYNVHLTDNPYQPYQLLNITFGPAPFLSTEDEAIAAAKKARGPALDLLYEDLEEADESVAFIFGDFNEPSGLDWTKDAAKAGLHPIRVRFPTTRALADVGFVDALRVVYPVAVAKPAFTWTPTTDPTSVEDHHDRIDYVLARGVKAITNASVVGEKTPEADIVVTPWPSDHRAVVVTVHI
jgi:exodeoxyribonuclease III